MNAFDHIEYLKGRVYSIALLMVSVFMVSQALGQGFNEKYDIYLIGQLTNDENGAPLKYHEVTIVSDTLNSTGFYYYNKVMTDHEGYYYDTIMTNQEKGALLINTIDHQDNAYDTIVYYRFNWSESVILFADFVLPAPAQVSGYQANFTYTGNPSGDNFKEYQFTDLTDNPNIISWSWDFDDGTHSQAQHPVHIFSQPGLYKVRLTVMISTGQNTEPFPSTIVKVIHITSKSYFHMGGHVFAGLFPIDKSEVYLFKIEGSDFVPIDTAIFNDTLGYFLFYQLIEGQYILKADLHPSSTLFDQFMTTYYSDKLHWYEADTIYHSFTSFEYDINLAPNSQAMATGSGAIGGQIVYDPGYGGGKSAPAENIAIILYDQSNQPVDICHSDEYGDFKLDQLEWQDYIVHAEVTGKITLPVEVALEENSNGTMVVNLVIDDQYVSGAVSPGIRDHQLNSKVSTVFPNPADKEATLNFDGVDGVITCSIINAVGQVYQTIDFTKNSGTSTIRFDVGHFDAGLYFILVSDRSGRTAIRKFVKD